MSFSPTISSFCINVSEKCKPSHLVRAAKDEARNGVFSSSSSSCDVYSSNSTNSFQKLTIVESLKVATSFAHPPSHPHQTTVLRLLQKVISMETSTTHRYRWPTVCCKLQLVRGLRLGAELNAPAWMMHCIRGLVCWWVLILGVQLMRVAWFVGVTAGARQHQSSTDD
ncbi:hypothetical protein V6N13_022114 [Hibiscus sabdariffa]